MPACRSCNASILFVRMESGKPMPCSVGADPNGNIAARAVQRVEDGPGAVYIDGYVITDERPLQDGFTRLLAHWAVCEKARRATPKPTPKPEAADRLF